MKNIPVSMPTNETINTIIVGDTVWGIEKKKKLTKLHVACMFWNASTSIIIERTIVPERKNTRKFLMDN